MFDSAYPFRCIGYDKTNTPSVLAGIRFFSFRTENHRYIVEVECYKENIYIIQYYAAIHKNAKNKYSLLTAEGKAGKIIRTCINIMVEIYAKDQLASFGFIGSNNIGEHTANTKRYRVYKKAMEIRMGTNSFTHAHNPVMSKYFMINKKKNPDEFLSLVDAMFSDMYDKE